MLVDVMTDPDSGRQTFGITLVSKASVYFFANTLGICDYIGSTCRIQQKGWRGRRSNMSNFVANTVLR
jgi:hypothetical protein